MSLSLVDHRPVVSSFPNDLREVLPPRVVTVDADSVRVLLVRLGAVDLFPMLGLEP